MSNQMKMSPENLLLLLINEAGSEGLQGRTMLQKLGYFLDVKFELGLTYNAYYYGPYSPKLENSLSEMKVLGFVKEKMEEFNTQNTSEFGHRRYNYEISTSGKNLLVKESQRDPDLYQKMRDYFSEIKTALGNGNYITLSIAAKIYHLIQREKVKTREELNTKARSLGWNLKNQNLKEAITFLRNLHLMPAD